MGDDRVIAIDLDGCLLQMAYPEFGAVNDGAIDVINEFRRNGCKIAIYTSRPYMDYEDIKKHLDINNVLYDLIICGKPIAKFYIDDRAIKYEGNWQEVRDKVLNK